MIHVAVAFLALAFQQPDTTRTRPDTMSLAPTAGQLADAYEDEFARELVRRARARRRTVDRSIDAYRAVARERMSASLRVPGRDRTLFRRETATRIDWKREGPIRLEVLGAREVLPTFMSGLQVPARLRNFVPHLAFDPEDSEVLLRLNDSALRNPLGPNAERHYRYRSGDTTEIRLPDGRTVRLVELRILPRRADYHLLRGSFWIEQETDAVVQAVFRQARAYDLEEDDEEDLPGFLEPIRFELDYITLEYAFWDFRWWLPRTVAAEGIAQATRLLKVPFAYTLSYSDYDVEGEADRPPEVVPADSARSTPCTAGWRMTISIRSSDEGGPVSMNGELVDEAQANPPDPELPADSAGSERESWRVDEATGIGVDRCGRVIQVELPTDSATLLASEALPPTIYESGDEWEAVRRRVRELSALLESIEEAPWRPAELNFEWGPGAPGGVRYNRVEGLALGARAGLDLGRLRFDGFAHLGLAEPRPDFELAITRPTLAREYRLSAYNGVREVDPATRAFGFGNSLNALVLGRDDGEYHHARGVTLELRPAPTRAQHYALRLFAERQGAIATEADFSLPTLWDDDHMFRPNIVADRADLYGGTLMLAGGLGADPSGWHADAVLDLDGAGGDFEFGRAALTLRLGLPRVGPWTAAFEGAAGSSIGSVPTQRLFYLGGPFTLRGYHGNATRGNAFWRTRAELGYGGAFGRLAAFGDAAWAGERDAFSLDEPLRSLGIGATLFDGLLRADLAHALDGPRGWRVDLWVSLSGL